MLVGIFFKFHFSPNVSFKAFSSINPTLTLRENNSLKQKRLWRTLTKEAAKKKNGTENQINLQKLRKKKNLMLYDSFCLILLINPCVFLVFLAQTFLHHFIFSAPLFLFALKHG